MTEEPPSLPSNSSPLSHERRTNDLLPSLDYHHATATSSETPPLESSTHQLSQKLGYEVGSSNSTHDLDFRCKLEELEVGFVQKEVIDEFLGFKDEVGVIMKGNSSEIVNLSQYDGGSSVGESGFETKCLIFDELLQNSSMSEDLTSFVMSDEIIVDVLKVEGKRKRRRGKNSNLKNATGFVGDSNVGKRKCVYSRNELEVLRYMNVKAQKKFWQMIYDGFSMIEKKEYDELGSFKHKKCGRSIYSDGKKNGNNEGNMGACSTSLSNNHHGILGESCVNFNEEIVSSSKSACDVDNGHNDYENGDFAGEWSEDEESSDEYENIQRPAFKVDGEPGFESGPPEDGLEYLRRVRWEAKQIPKVKVVKLNNIRVKDQSVYMPMIPDIKECPLHLFPLKTWEDEFITDFSNLRLALSCFASSNGAGSAESVSVNFACHEPERNPSKKLASLELTTSGGPMTSTVLAMDAVTRVTMLRKRISLFETASELSKDECAWLFALCAVVETPLDADTCASLRCLLRKCAKLRAEKTQVDDEVAMLNVMATISGRFFGQLEY